MSDDSVVSYERNGPVAWITMNRPAQRNALNASVREGLFEGIERFNLDTEAQVLVITGSGDVAFSAGADLKEMATTQMSMPPPDFLPEIGFNVNVEKVTIAAVNGVAFAGGFLLAQTCDLCIASDNAVFGVTEAKVGRGFAWAVPLPWLMPPRAALELLVTGKPIGAARAYELGLVNKVVSPADLHSSAQAMGERIAANAPLTVRAAKRTIQLTMNRPLSEAHSEARELWEHVYNSEDAQEGPRAFAEGRRPEWQGK